MKILAIGNSFSQDATRYLHDIALADNYCLKVVNLYIGGCSLKTHWENVLNNSSLYAYQVNGETTDKMISIEEALKSDEWDYITFQQASPFSIDYATYQPYLSNLSNYVKQYSPNAQQVIHQTWAYEQGSERLAIELGYANQYDMFANLKLSYDRAAKDLGGLNIIPSGEGFQNAINVGIEKLHRDTFHASLGIGRYLLGAIWYESLTGNSILPNLFRDFDEAITDEEIAILKKCAHKAVMKYKWKVLE